MTDKTTEGAGEPEFYKVGSAHELCRFPGGSWSLRYRSDDGPEHIRYLNQYEGDMVEGVRSQLEAVTKERDEALAINLESNRFYRLMNGLDEDDHDKRAEHVMKQQLDGLTICDTNRTSVKAYLAEHFQAVAEAAEQRAQEVGRRVRQECAKVCDDTVAHIKENAVNLARCGAFAEDEARVRQLASVYVSECAQAIREGEK